MDRQGFKDFNTRLSPENSGKAASKRMQMKVYFQFAEREQARPEVKADSYARAISADAHTVCLTSAFRECESQEYYTKHFGSVNGQQIMLPINYKPNRDFLAYHRDHVFIGI